MAKTSRYIVLDPAACTYELVEAPADIDEFASEKGMAAERNGTYVSHRPPYLQVIKLGDLKIFDFHKKQ